ncbi:MAG: hypothetical protein IJK12_06250 [Clostridia bacterium]|nr:hypothetical protein [Clostridia bacterium]MBR2645219.1 hypothetical protein [Clostridia bacterium]MBR3037540.1 hypothetical protein [Clostridia bacterium]
MERMELYRIEETEQLEARRKSALRAMCIVGAVGLAVCGTLCAFITMKNHRVLQWTAVGASVVFGWAVIFLHHAVYNEAATLCRHAERMCEAERETYTGTFEQTDTVLRVRKGVTLRRVRAVCGGREHMLNLCEAKAKLLPASFSGTVETADFFIVAAEVNGNA